jgi:hypothetical protein
MNPERKITTRGTSVMVSSALRAALFAARFRLPRLFFLSLILLLALGACALNLKGNSLNPPKWIQGYWLCPYTDLNDGRMAYYFSDSAFEIGTKRDDGFDSVEQYAELNSDSYEQSSSTQYVLHIVEHCFSTTYDITNDWTFTRLSDTQIEEDGDVLSRF